MTSDGTNLVVIAQRAGHVPEQLTFVGPLSMVVRTYHETNAPLYMRIQAYTEFLTRVRSVLPTADIAQQFEMGLNSLILFEMESDEEDNDDNSDDEQVEGNTERRDAFINHIDVVDMEYGMLRTMERVEFAIRTILNLMPDRFVA